MGITDTAAAFSFRDSLFAKAESSKLPGGAQKDQGIGIVSFLTAVSSGSAIFAFQLLLFLLLRNKLAPSPKRIYSLGVSKQIRRTVASSNFFGGYGM
ncbi:hypothetical protein CEP54_014119 [Fusarium duplospermum]|uniref:Uncharacterized protein n=1 Tax=Fusarium duplospermum TaxID=1325734 RepID=A0A428NYJ4_9HYPO|nr:hypothetical protein CEP54_014119 [Fusarium duplospermum]